MSRDFRISYWAVESRALLRLMIFCCTAKASRLTLADGSLPAAQAAVRQLRRLLSSTLAKTNTQLIARGLDGSQPPRPVRGDVRPSGGLKRFALLPQPARRGSRHRGQLSLLRSRGYFESTRQFSNCTPRKKGRRHLDPRLRRRAGTLQQPGSLRDVEADAAGGSPHVTAADCRSIPALRWITKSFSISKVFWAIISASPMFFTTARSSSSPLFQALKRFLRAAARPLEARTTGGATSTCPWTFAETKKFRLQDPALSRALREIELSCANWGCWKPRRCASTVTA